MKNQWIRTNNKLPSPDEEVLGFACSPDLEDLGYHVVNFDPEADAWHEVNGRRSFKNITHWLPLEPPTVILRLIHREQEKKRKRIRKENMRRRESDRNKDIVIRLLNGQKTQEVGDLYGISQSRAATIAKRILKKIAPQMDCSLYDMRKLKGYFLKRIEEL
ncbi:MAG: DUF551 domain-containing protein [Syntrophorhabdus sp.]